MGERAIGSASDVGVEDCGAVSRTLVGRGLLPVRSRATRASRRGSRRDGSTAGRETPQYGPQARKSFKTRPKTRQPKTRAAPHQTLHHLIVGSDLLYRLPVVAPLLAVLRELVGESTVALLAASAQHSPEAIRAFVAGARRDGLDVQAMHASAQHPSYTSEEVRLLRVTRR